MAIGVEGLGPAAALRALARAPTRAGVKNPRHLNIETAVGWPVRSAEFQFHPESFRRFSISNILVFLQRERRPKRNYK